MGVSVPLQPYVIAVDLPHCSNVLPHPSTTAISKPQSYLHIHKYTIYPSHLTIWKTALPYANHIRPKDLQITANAPSWPPHKAFSFPKASNNTFSLPAPRQKLPQYRVIPLVHPHHPPRINHRSTSTCSTALSSLSFPYQHSTLSAEHGSSI